MRCPRCHGQTPDDGKYCMICGSPLFSEKTEKVSFLKKIKTQIEKSNTEEPVATETPVTKEMPVTTESSVGAEVPSTSETFVATETPAVTETLVSTDTSSEISAPPFQATQKKRKTIKKRVFRVVLAISLIALLAVGGIVVYQMFFAGGKYPVYENYISFVYDEASDETLVFYNTKCLDDTIEGEADIIERSRNGDVALIFVYDQSASLVGYGSLYAINKEGIQKVAERVDCECWQLSQTGEKILFVNEEKILHLVSLETMELTEIDGNIVARPMFSPDGKTIIYIVSVNDDDSYISYCYSNGKKEKLPEDILPVLPSNNGKLLWGIDLGAYFDENESSFVVYNTKNDTMKTLSKKETDISSLYFNINHTECLYTTKDGKCYLSVNGETKVKLGNFSNVWPLSTLDAVQSEMFPLVLSPVFSFICAPILCLDEKGDTCIGFIDKEFNFIKLPRTDFDSQNTLPQVSADGDTVYYIKNDNLYRIAVKEGASPEKLAKDVLTFWVTSDEKKVYYTNEENELMCLVGDEDYTIESDVDPYTIRLSADDTLFYIADYDDEEGGTLYRCTNGKQGKYVTDSVLSLSVTPKGVLYASFVRSSSDNNQWVVDIFSSDNDKDFSKIASDVYVSSRYSMWE